MPETGKASDAFRNISEFAEELDLPQHGLRFWETRFNQIKPMKRGGGRRYYRPEDVDLLRGVRLLLYTEGLTIRGVQRVLKDRGASYVADLGQTGSKHVEIASATELGADPGQSDSDVGDDRAPELAAEPEAARAREDGPNVDLRTDPGFAPEEDSDDLAHDADTERSGGASDAPDLPAVEAGDSQRGTGPVPALFHLSENRRRRIEAAVSDLLEAKRLLDQVK